MMKTNISAGHSAPAYIWRSPIGPLGIVTSERGVVRIQFTHEQDGVATDVQDEFTRACIQQLDEYFAGQRREFTIPLDIRGTPFQLACWNALLRIPYGETRSYAEQAVVVGSPRAFRAVGAANGSNPIPIIVPCHRVLNTGGKLGGYGGGLPIKERLLRLEGAWPTGTKALFATAD
jgi:methylated-DNA-[protein]-cysteine S-methyltransferase